MTIAELLVILAIVGLLLALTVPQAGNHIRSSRVRLAADRLASDLRSCRITAVTDRKPHALQLVGSLPASAYTFTDLEGTVHTVDLPDGIRITSASQFPVTFTHLGGLQGHAATASVKGAITSSRAHEFTIRIARSGLVSKDFDGNAVP
jgi:type II secretory pathway pseudopilin PulG